VPFPDAAANEYLMALGYNTEEGLLPILDDEYLNHLLAEWRVSRAMRQDGSAANAAGLGCRVGAEWASGGDHEHCGDVVGVPMSSRVLEQQRRFEIRKTTVCWRVLALDAPAWCGGYVRLDACT
jgi:hypothetical protein